jgi:hypothetical protein
MGKRRRHQIGRGWRPLPICPTRGKKEYSKREAVRAAARSRTRTGDANIVHYRCPDNAHHWHIGHDHMHHGERTNPRNLALANRPPAALSREVERARLSRSEPEGTSPDPTVGTVTESVRSTLAGTKEELR